jgi:hypothetical protein
MRHMHNSSTQRQDGRNGLGRVGRGQRAERACQSGGGASTRSRRGGQSTPQTSCAKAATRQRRRLPSRRQRPERVANVARRPWNHSQSNEDRDVEKTVAAVRVTDKAAMEPGSAAEEERPPRSQAERQTRGRPPPWMVVAVGVRSGCMCALVCTCVIVSCRLRP